MVPRRGVPRVHFFQSCRIPPEQGSRHSPRTNLKHVLLEPAESLLHTLGMDAAPKDTAARIASPHGQPLAPARPAARGASPPTPCALDPPFARPDACGASLRAPCAEGWPWCDGSLGGGGLPVLCVLASRATWQFAGSGGGGGLPGLPEKSEGWVLEAAPNRGALRQGGTTSAWGRLAVASAARGASPPTPHRPLPAARGASPPTPRRPLLSRCRRRLASRCISRSRAGLRSRLRPRRWRWK